MNQDCVVNSVIKELSVVFCCDIHIRICRVRHKHSPTRHGEWKLHLASMTWKSLAKVASMKFEPKHYGEYEIKVTRQIKYALRYFYQSYLFQISFISININENFARAESQYKYNYGDVISASITHDLRTWTQINIP